MKSAKTILLASAYDFLSSTDGMKLIIFLPVLLLSTFLSLLDVPTAQAGSATWTLNPTSGDWNTAANWTPATIPNSPTDIATFSAL